MLKVVIIIPTYNEAPTIQNTLSLLFKELSTTEEYDINVLIFDSASTDDTQAIVSSLQAIYPKLLLISEPQKTGLGSAYHQAMHYAIDDLNADIVFEFDADLSHQPKYIFPMLEKLKTHEVVIGSRYVSGGSIPKGWPLQRKLFSVLGNYVIRLVLTPRFKDFTSGFRGFQSHALKITLPSKFLSNHYAYKLQLLWLLYKSKAAIVEFPIEFIDRQRGESKLPKNSILDTLRVIFTIRYGELKQYFNMCLVGSFGILTQFFVYNFLRHYVSLINASQTAVLIAIIQNFFLNHHLTFKGQAKAWRKIYTRRLSSFIFYSLVMIGLQSYWLQWGVSCLGRGAWRENFILATGIGLGSILNYFVYSRWIWSKNKSVDHLHTSREQPKYNSSMEY